MYDVVVVGAGSAGCVIASRLAEESDRRVLLLEAGSQGTADEWSDAVETAGGRVVPYRRGRGLGGSSSINGAVALRPAPDDFAAWPDGWHWDEMLPVLRRLERDVDYGDAPYHGDRGPVPIVRFPEAEWGPVHHAFGQACADAGFARCADLNQPDARGFGPVPMNRIGRERVSMAAAYLEPAGRMTNLQVRGGSAVTRITWLPGSPPTAAGVELEGGDVIPCGEVIVACGAIASPLLLRRSGFDRPGMGANLSDHFFVELGTAIDEALVPQYSPTSQTMLRWSEGPGGGVDLHLVPFAARASGAARFGIRVSLQAPTGSGSVVAPEDSCAPVRLRWPFLEQRGNVARLRMGWRLACELLAATGLSRDQAGLSGMQAMADGEVDAMIVATHLPFFHAASTCAMGVVVDGECRLMDAERVRVVDASVIPRAPRANIHLTVLAVAERAADFVVR